MKNGVAEGVASDSHDTKSALQCVIIIINKPERVFGLQVRYRELYIFKIRNFWEILWFFRGFVFYFSWILFGGIFWEDFLWGFFGGIFLWGFFWRIFCEDFWEDFLGGFFGRNSLFTLLKSSKLFESERDWCFCQDFVSMEKEEEENFNP